MRSLALNEREGMKRVAVHRKGGFVGLNASQLAERLGGCAKRMVIGPNGRWLAEMRASWA
jgi:hypothetical protein